MAEKEERRKANNDGKATARERQEGGERGSGREGREGREGKGEKETGKGKEEKGVLTAWRVDLDPTPPMTLNGVRERGGAGGEVQDKNPWA